MEKEICDDGTFTNWGSRDINCALDVARMERMGKFPVEMDVYGCAYLENGQVLYRVSSNEEKLYEYIQDSVYENRYPTVMKHLMHSVVVLSGEYEQTVEETKYMLARQMQAQYAGLFDVLQPLAEIEPNNEAFPFLRQMAESIEGNFDEEELQLLEGSIKFAYRAKILAPDGYRQLLNWIEKQRLQMMDDPVVQDKFGRTFYGFGYLNSHNELKYECDAQKVNIYEKQQAYTMEGRLVMPLYWQSYWFASRSQLNGVKKIFRSELAKNQGESYLQFLKQLKSLPGVIPAGQLNRAIQKMEQKGAAEAAAVLNYYKCLWNLC